MFVSKQELPKSSLSVSPTSYDSHGFSLLDAHHLVRLVPARYPLFEGNNALMQLQDSCLRCLQIRVCLLVGVSLSSSTDQADICRSNGGF